MSESTATHQATLDHLRSAYGVQTSDTFEGDIAALHRIDRVAMTTGGFLGAGGRFTRIRLLGDPGYPYLDVSYVYGVLADGTEVRVSDFGHDSRLGRRTYRSQLAKEIKTAGGSYTQCQQAWNTDCYAILWG